MSNAAYTHGSDYARSRTPSPSPSSLRSSVSDDEVEEEQDHEPAFTQTVILHGKPIILPFDSASATIQDLSNTVAEVLQIPATNQKFHITPKTGRHLLPTQISNCLHSQRRRSLSSAPPHPKSQTSHPASNPTSPNFATAPKLAHKHGTTSLLALATGRKHKTRRGILSTQLNLYRTFRSQRRAKRSLERLRDDAGIKASMRKHGFAVGLLTEMDPAEHTTHESRTLGLNSG